jgi:hypothetical protein
MFSIPVSMLSRYGGPKTGAIREAHRQIPSATRPPLGPASPLNGHVAARLIEESGAQLRWS